MTTAVTTIENAAVQAQSLNDLTASWISFIRKCEKTRRTYEVAIRQWKNFCADNAIVNPARVDIEHFIDSMKAAKKSVSTVQLYCTAIRLFYRWTAQENLYPNIADNLKAEVKKSYKHKKSALTAQQGGKLIQSISGSKILDRRNKAIIALTISAGLRTIELHRADIGDIKEVDGRHYLKVQCKGHSEKDEEVLIAEQVYSLIMDYISARGVVDDSEPLFVSHRRNLNGRLNTQTISKMIKKHLRAIGLDSKEYSAHSLRHSAAVQMLLNGVELRKVQACLHHRNIQTTLIYAGTVDRLKNNSEQIAADAFFSNI